MEDFTCKYPKHECQLKEQQKTKRTGWWFEKLFLISDKNIWAMWYLRSKGGVQLEIMRQRSSPSPYIFHPFSMTRFYWEIFMVCLTFVSMVFLFVRFSLLNSYIAKGHLMEGRSLDGIRNGLLVQFVLTLIWSADMIGNFFTGYYDRESGTVVMDPKRVFRKYLTRGFVVDLSCSIPVECIWVKFYGIKSYANMSPTSFVILVFFNLYTFVRFRRYVLYYFRFPRVGFPLYVTKIFKNSGIYIIMIHMELCLTLVVSEMICRGRAASGKITCDSWLQVTKFSNMAFREQYSLGLLIALNNGVCHINGQVFVYSIEDYVLAIFISLCRRAYELYFLISFLQMFTVLHALRRKFILIMDDVKIYMKKKELPVGLKKRLSRFYLYRFQAHYFRDRSILNRLTESLRMEIGNYTCQRVINNTEVFGSLPKEVLTRLAQRMQREMYFPNDVIVQGNAFGECMYFICSGVVSVKTVTGNEICLLRDGGFFGEIALVLPDRRRTATVTAVTITEVYRLESTDYHKIIELYPEVNYRLEKFALERYKTIMSVEGKSEDKRQESG